MTDDPKTLEMAYLMRVYFRGKAELEYRQARCRYVEKLAAYMETLRAEEKALQDYIKCYNTENIRADVQTI
jgi:hypothetical protein